MREAGIESEYAAAATEDREDSKWAMDAALRMIYLC